MNADETWYNIFSSDPLIWFSVLIIGKIAEVISDSDTLNNDGKLVLGKHRSN